MATSKRRITLEKLISDISDCVSNMKKLYSQSNEPITDDESTFHRFCNKLEQALEYGRKSRGLFGSEKCFWNYFCQCLVSGKSAHDGLKFAKFSDELKTSYGRGRAFVRYCLMHNCLADTLQQCFINEKVTRDWYEDFSIPFNPKLWSVLTTSLYDLNEVQFDLSPHVHDLDQGWPVFARKIFPSAYSWRPPSRSMSISSLNSTLSHTVDASVNSSIIEVNEDDALDKSSYTKDMEQKLDELKIREQSLESQIELMKKDVEEKCNLELKLKEIEKKLEDERLMHKEENESWITKEKDYFAKIESEKKFAAEQNAANLAKVNEFEVNKAELTETISKLQTLNDSQEIKLKTLEEEIGEVRAANYVGQISDLSSKMMQMVASNEAVVKKLEIENSCKDDKCKNLEAQLSDTLFENESLCNKIAEFENVNSSNAQLRKIVEDLESNKTGLVEQLKSLEKETSILQDDVSRKDREILSLQQQNGDQQNEIDTILSNIPEVPEPTVVENCSSCDVHKARALSLSDEIERLKKVKVKLDLDKMQVERKYQSLTSEYEDSQSHLAEKEKIIVRSKTEIAELKKNMESIDVILSKQEQMIDSLENKLKVSLEDNVKLSNEMKNLHDSVEPELREETAQAEIFVPESPEAETSIDDVDNRPESAPPVLTTASRTLTRLKSLVEEGEGIKCIVETAKEVKSNMINKVQEQEEKLKHQQEVIEQSETKFKTLKSRHVKLKTSESILRYELREKRNMLEKLKKQLQSSRRTWQYGKLLQDTAEANWKSLQEDVASRPKLRRTDESDDKVNEANLDSAIDSQASSIHEMPNSEEHVDSVNSEPRDTSPAGSESESPPITYEMRAKKSEGRLQYLEEQCRFLYARLVQSSKKSDYLESKLNKILGFNSDGSDTEDNVESITELDDADCGIASVSPKEPSVEIEVETMDNSSLLIEKQTSFDDLDTTNNELYTTAIEEDIPLSNCSMVSDEVDEKLESDEIDGKLESDEMELSCIKSDSKNGLLEVHESGNSTEEDTWVEEREKMCGRIRDLNESNIQLQSVVDKLQNQLTSLETSNQRLKESVEVLNCEKMHLEKEVTSIKFQLSTEVMKKDSALQGYLEHESNIESMQAQITEQEHLIIYLEESLKDIKLGREVEKAKQLQELQELQLVLATRNKECRALTDQLKELKKKLDEETRRVLELKSLMDDAKDDNVVFISKLESELVQLRKDNRDLMDKLVKLIRDKDILWQKTDRLTDMQKSSSPGRWMDNHETNRCLECSADFSFFLRKHHCRLCGGIFCRECSNNWVMIAASSTKSRVCNNCFVNQDANPLEVKDKSVLGNDSEEECEKTQNTDCLEASIEKFYRLRSFSESNSASCSFNQERFNISMDLDEQFSAHPKQKLHFRSSSAPGAFNITRDRDGELGDNNDNFRDEGFCVISDEEISRSLSGTSPYSSHKDNSIYNSIQMATTKTIFDIPGEKDVQEYSEVWINAGGCYSIPIFIEDEAVTLLWEFSTEPRSIAFAVHYKEVDVDPSDVVVQPLLPTTRCKSHLFPIHGSLRIKRKGIYTLMFDNRFSMIMAKKLKYMLKIRS